MSDHPEVTASMLYAAHSRLLYAQGEALKLAVTACRPRALAMPGATLPEVIASLPGPERQAVTELYGTLGSPVITDPGAQLAEGEASG